MPSSADTPYSFPFRMPDLLERGTACTLACPVYRSGALVTPSAAGSVSLYDPDNNAVFTDTAAPLVSNIATYTYTPPTSLRFAEGYRVEWTITIGGGANKATNEAAVVRRRLQCPISDQDLYRVAAVLDPNPAVGRPISARTTYQDFIDEAWTQVQLRLIAEGNRPNLIVSPSALRQPVLHLALELIFLNLATYDNEAYRATADEHRKRFREAWSEMRLTLAYEDDGAVETRRRKGGASTVFLGTGRRNPWCW